MAGIFQHFKVSVDRLRDNPAYARTALRTWVVDQLDVKWTNHLVDSCQGPYTMCLLKSLEMEIFNAASLAVWQNEEHAVELRLRTCLELAINRHFYRPIRSANKHRHGHVSVESFFDLTCFAAESSDTYGKDGFEAALNNEIMKTARNYEYSGTLQIMGLASVLGIPVETLYPDQNNTLLPIFQTVFYPRQNREFLNSTPTVKIMWTNTRGWPDKSKEFVVNHFVPLIKQSASESDNSNDGWSYRKRRRSRTTAEQDRKKTTAGEHGNRHREGEHKDERDHMHKDSGQTTTKRAAQNEKRRKKETKPKNKKKQSQESVHEQEKMEQDPEKESQESGHKQEKMEQDQEKESQESGHKQEKMEQAISEF